jgi:hypothetical protein
MRSCIATGETKMNKIILVATVASLAQLITSAAAQRQQFIDGIPIPDYSRGIPSQLHVTVVGDGCGGWGSGIVRWIEEASANAINNRPASVSEAKRLVQKQVHDRHAKVLESGRILTLVPQMVVPGDRWANLEDAISRIDSATIHKCFLAFESLLNNTERSVAEDAEAEIQRQKAEVARQKAETNRQAIEAERHRQEVVKAERQRQELAKREAVARETAAAEAEQKRQEQATREAEALQAQAELDAAEEQQQQAETARQVAEAEQRKAEATRQTQELAKREAAAREAIAPILERQRQELAKREAAAREAAAAEAEQQRQEQATREAEARQAQAEQNAERSSPRGHVQRAYLAYIMTKSCYETREGYLLKWINDAELERSETAIRAIVDKWKNEDQNMDTDLLWQQADKHVVGEPINMNTCRHWYKELLDMSPIPSVRIEKPL